MVWSVSAIALWNAPARTSTSASWVECRHLQSMFALWAPFPPFQLQQSKNILSCDGGGWLHEGELVITSTFHYQWVEVSGFVVTLSLDASLGQSTNEPPNKSWLASFQCVPRESWSNCHCCCHLLNPCLHYDAGVNRFILTFFYWAVFASPVLSLFLLFWQLAHSLVRCWIIVLIVVAAVLITSVCF